MFFALHGERASHCPMQASDVHRLHMHFLQDVVGILFLQLIVNL